MTPLLHALHIGTLAAWLTAGSLGVVGLVMPEWVGRPEIPALPTTEVIWVTPELHPAPEPSVSPPAETVPEPTEQAAPDEIPVPPAMPEVADLPPLPEIPDLPPEPPRTASPTPSAAPPAARPRAATTQRPAGSTRVPGSRSSPGSAGTPSQGGGEMSQAARIAAGHMPGPAFPAEARRKNQTGTVMVEFTVGNNGRVISAHAASPSPWPLLNEAAVRAVRTWRFPPGAVMTLRRPISFQLR